MAKNEPISNAKYVWMVVNSRIRRYKNPMRPKQGYEYFENPCDIRRYAFSHREAVEQLRHVQKTWHKYKDVAGSGVWTLFKLVRVNKRRA